MALNSKTEQARQQVSNIIFSGVKAVVRRRATPWAITMTDLETTLRTRVSKVPATWPGSASAFRVALNRVVYRLRSAGVSVRFSRLNNHTRTRLVIFKTR